MNETEQLEFNGQTRKWNQVREKVRQPITIGVGHACRVIG